MLPPQPAPANGEAWMASNAVLTFASENAGPMVAKRMTSPELTVCVVVKSSVMPVLGMTYVSAVPSWMTGPVLRFASSEIVKEIPAVPAAPVDWNVT